MNDETRSTQTEPNVFTITPEEAWILSEFLQSWMTGDEPVGDIGLIASKLYHFCRENPVL